MVVCEGFIQPLNLECLFINTLAGGIGIFIAIAIMAIAVMAAKFRMSNFTTMAMFVVFVILFFPILGAELGILYLLVALILGLIIFKISANIIKR